MATVSPASPRRDWFEDVVEIDPSFFTEPPYTHRNNQNDVVAQPMKKRDVFDYHLDRKPKGIGAIISQIITDDNRPQIVEFCKLALDTYNAENQNAKFEFAELLHFNRVLCNGWICFITFEAKDAADSTSATHTFQAKVWNKMLEKSRVLLCRVKPW